MEASATTVNISGPSVEQPASHNHKPNFGRYVKDCPRCIELFPNGPQKRERKAAKPEVAGMTKDEIIALLREHAPAASGATSTEQLTQLVQLMLSKQTKELKKEEEAEAQRQRAREDMVRITREYEALVKAGQDNCAHQKENGRTAIAQGQVYNDGFMRPFCQKCMKQFPKRRPSPEEMPTSVA